MFPAPRQTATKWIVALGACTAGQMSADDVKMKVKVYADLLDEPEFAYTKESLKAAATKFKWFPSFAELQEFLECQGGEIRRLNRRLVAISTLPTDEEIAAKKAEEEAARLAKMLSTPAGRIRHKHWGRYSHATSRNIEHGWWRLVDSLLDLHHEELVDAWHVEVAAMDWGASGFDALGELRARSRAALPETEAEAQYNAAFWREAAEKRAQRQAGNGGAASDAKRP